VLHFPTDQHLADGYLKPPIDESRRRIREDVRQFVGPVVKLVTREHVLTRTASLQR
jgi:hypothetical protein